MVVDPGRNARPVLLAPTYKSPATLIFDLLSEVSMVSSSSSSSGSSSSSSGSSATSPTSLGHTRPNVPSHGFGTSTAIPQGVVVDEPSLEIVDGLMAPSSDVGNTTFRIHPVKNVDPLEVDLE
ncbi:hypothetical protein Salat_0434100 [Sesamum alatum]|uniref:Uncharacterized protein n=1 Tax=Sesamum alatum TaxID=300844 RepID=A0AAE1Z329_9LAMI|nr:hypothetical protein Salat_0434100 [Sesamum alatum]